jgi:hypothetical protein
MDLVVWSLQPARKKQWQLVTETTTIKYFVAAPPILSIVEDGERNFHIISTSIDGLATYQSISNDFKVCSAVQACPMAYANKVAPFACHVFVVGMH